MKLWPGRRVRYVLLLAAGAVGAYLTQRRWSRAPEPPAVFRSVPTTSSPPRPASREEPKTPVHGLAAQPAATVQADGEPAPPAAKPAAAKPSPVARPKPKPAPQAAATSGAQSKATAGLPASEPYGEGSALPLADGAAPSPEYTIKGNASSKLFHTPSSPYYRRTIAEVWFRTEDDAKRAGFTGWARKSRVNPSG